MEKNYVYFFHTKYNGITDWWWLVGYFATTCHLSQLPSMSCMQFWIFLWMIWYDMPLCLFERNIFFLHENASHFMICLFFLSLIILMPAKDLSCEVTTKLDCTATLHKSCVDKSIIKMEKNGVPSNIQSYVSTKLRV